MLIATFCIAVVALALVTGLYVQRWWERRCIRNVLRDAARQAAVQQLAAHRGATLVEHPASPWRTYPKGTN